MEKVKLLSFIYKIIYVLTILASVVLIVDIMIEDIPNIQKSVAILPSKIQFWICIYFLIDFFILILMAKDKWRYLKRYFVLILLSIPYLNILNYFSVDISHDLFYFLKLLPVLRGVIALALLVNIMTSNKITGFFVAYIFIFISFTYIQTLIFYLFEGGKNPDIKNYYDVLWWASMTVTSLGSNIIPVTSYGKISTFVLAITGITIFPIFTVYISTIIRSLEHKSKP